MIFSGNQLRRGNRVSATSAKRISNSHKAIAKRDAIIGTAIRIINEKSYELATMRELPRRSTCAMRRSIIISPVNRRLPTQGIFNRSNVSNERY